MIPIEGNGIEMIATRARLELDPTPPVKELAKADAAGGALLDGFPRDMAQAEALDGALAAREVRLQALYLDVAPEALARRLSGRRTCPDCHATYHIDAHPPVEEDHCDGCGAALRQQMGRAHA